MIRHIRKTRKNEQGMMSDASRDMIDEPVIDALVREIRSRYDEVFDTISVEGNKLILHFDDEDASLEIEVRGTKCIPTLCIPLSHSNIELNQDVRDFIKHILDESSCYF